MNNDMFDDDADLIEQVSDDEDENMEVDHRRGRHGGLEEEPALEGYERYGKDNCFLLHTTFLSILQFIFIP
jgi:hypothetical protein